MTDDWEEVEIESTPEELAEWQELADAAGLSLNDWMRKGMSHGVKVHKEWRRALEESPLPDTPPSSWDNE